jgi:hypothetical protein
MSNPHAASAAASDAHSYAVKAAEEAFILQAQSEIESLMKLRNVRPRVLSRRMKVSEARISQLLGDKGGKNLTLRTIARIFHCLNETPHLGAASAWQGEGQASEAEPAADLVVAGKWTIKGKLLDGRAAPRSGAKAGADDDHLRSSKSKISSWANVELNVPVPPSSTTSRAK